MPTYEYRCKGCGRELEVVQSFDEPSLTVCPHCSGPLRKVFGSIGITFKGDGFYKTDSRSGSKKSSSSSSSNGDSGTSNGDHGHSHSHGDHSHTPLQLGVVLDFFVVLVFFVLVFSRRASSGSSTSD